MANIWLTVLIILALVLLSAFFVYLSYLSGSSLFKGLRRGAGAATDTNVKSTSWNHGQHSHISVTPKNENDPPLT